MSLFLTFEEQEYVPLIMDESERFTRVVQKGLGYTKCSVSFFLKKKKSIGIGSWGERAMGVIILMIFWAAIR